MAGEKVYIADKETLDKVYNILAVDPIYGFIEHMNILSPTQRIEYIGLNKNFTPVSRNTNGSISLNDWAGFEILEANKPYMVRDHPRVGGEKFEDVRNIVGQIGSSPRRRGKDGNEVQLIAAEGITPA